MQPEQDPTELRICCLQTASRVCCRPPTLDKQNGGWVGGWGRKIKDRVVLAAPHAPQLDWWRN